MMNNLFYHFEALWPKMLPPDLKTLCTFFLLTLYYFCSAKTIRDVAFFLARCLLICIGNLIFRKQEIKIIVPKTK